MDEQTHEVRYRGQLIEHFSQRDARAYVRRRLEDKTEGHLFAAEDWTVSLRRPVELRSNGGLVDTFDDVEAAAQDRDRRMEDASRVRAFARHAPQWSIVDRRNEERAVRSPGKEASR